MCQGNYEKIIDITSRIIYQTCKNYRDAFWCPAGQKGKPV
jgi:hypothetical protein